MSNLDQSDSNDDGVGNACHEDCDGDGFKNQDDVCPCNSGIAKTDFRLPRKIFIFGIFIFDIFESPKSRIKCQSLDLTLLNTSLVFEYSR